MMSVQKTSQSSMEGYFSSLLILKITSMNSCRRTYTKHTDKVNLHQEKSIIVDHCSQGLP